MGKTEALVLIEEIKALEKSKPDLKKSFEQFLKDKKQFEEMQKMFNRSSKEEDYFSYGASPRTSN